MDEAERIREQALAILEEVAVPLVADGFARIDRAGPESELVEGSVELVPVREGAGSVWLDPAPDFLTLVVSPGGRAHEILPRDDWEDELRGCIEAVVEGRYRQVRRRRRLLGTVLEMTFERPDAADVVVRHYGVGLEGPEGEQRFASYR